MTKDMLARAVRKFKKGDMHAFDYIRLHPQGGVFCGVFRSPLKREG